MRIRALAVATVLSACAAPPLAPLVPETPAPAPGPAIIAAPNRPALRPGAPPGCRVTQVASLRLLPFDADKPLVEIAVNGRRLRMQVDTGAETSVLTIAGAAAIGLSPGPLRRQVEGLGGTAGYGTVHLDRITFGGQVLRGLDLPVMQLRDAAGVDGLIGADLLAPYQVLLDFQARQMTLLRADRCAAPHPPFAAIELAWTSPHAMPIVAARLNGRPLAALLDTGAHRSAIDTARSGLTEADLRRDPQVQSYGAGGQTLAGRAHRFASLTLGGVSLPGPTLQVITLDPTLAIGLVIGMDILAPRRLWLDYPGRRVFIETAPAS
jgi:predicted aspartyl protease